MNPVCPRSFALIVAAGRGRRMGAARPKQYLDLSGQTVLARTLAALDAAAGFERLVLVVPPDDIDYCRQEIVAPLRLNASVDLVAGGDERQDSVGRGLEALDDAPGDAVVAVHDGVRPFVAPALVARCIETARLRGSAVPVLAVAETIKTLDAAGRVTGSPERRHLFAAQTPQAFSLHLIREAHQAARCRGRIGTDDAALVEALGHPVHTTAGDRLNLKITTPEDLALARAILAAALWPPPE